MAEAKQGDTVHVHYTGRLQDGTTFDSSQDRDPLEITIGEGAVIPGFEKAVQGMSVGDQKTAEVPVEEAYGPRRDELVMDVPRTQLPEGLDPKPGEQLRMQTPDGQAVPVVVADTTEEEIKIDANHPLAGEELTFDLLLVKIA
ncbi:MAG: peptidylprolyl isomerase [Gemmatimonadota bacterium]|nr:peptidylprolyl isomerase [Gemmatimonadota bacterium]